MSRVEKLKKQMVLTGRSDFVAQRVAGGTQGWNLASLAQRRSVGDPLCGRQRATGIPILPAEARVFAPSRPVGIVGIFILSTTSTSS